jgi:hypothetical protein
MLEKHPKMLTYDAVKKELLPNLEPSPIDIYNGDININAYLNYSSENQDDTITVQFLTVKVDADPAKRIGC